MSFPGSALGRGERSQRRVGQQSLRDFSDYPTMRDFQSNGGPIPIDFGTVDPGKIASGGAPLPSLPIKGGGIEYTIPLGNVDPNDYFGVHALANLFGFYSVEGNEAGSLPDTWWKWKFSLDQAVAAAEFLEIHDDNDRWRTRFLNNRMSSYQVVIGDNGRIDQNASLVNPKEWDYWGAVTQTVGSGSTKPTVRGPVSEVLTTESLAALLLEAQVVSGSNVTLRNKDTGGTYTNTQAYVIGNRATRLKNSATPGDRGTVARPYLVAWPTGSTLVSLDEFTIQRRIARWSQTLPNQYRIPAINGTLYLDGVEIPIEGDITIDVGWEQSEARLNRFLEFGGGISRAGKLIATIGLSREFVDMELQAKLHNRTTASVVLNGRTDTEIDTDEKAVYRVVAPNVTLEGSMFALDEGALNTEETVNLVCGVPESTYTDPFGDEWDSHIGFLLHNLIPSF